MNRRDWFASLFGGIFAILGWKIAKPVWQELSKPEIITNRLAIAHQLKSSQLMSDYDILTRWLQYDKKMPKKF